MKNDKVLDFNLQIPQKVVPFVASDKIFNILYGGRGGGKSEALAQIAILHSFYGKGKLLITRYIEKSIDTSNKSTITRWIHKLKLSKYFNIKQKYIENLITGATFIFNGLSLKTMDNIASIDNVFFAWIDEAHKIPKEAWQRFYPSIRGTYSDGSPAKIYASFNPHKESDTFWELFVIKPRDDALVVKIGLDDNPWFKYSVVKSGGELIKIESALYKQYKSDLKYMPASYNKHIWGGDLKAYNDDVVIDVDRIARFDNLASIDYDKLVLSIDTAYSMKEAADYSVLALFGMIDNDIHVLRVRRGRMEFDTLLQAIKSTYQQASIDYNKAPVLLIENKASGQSIIQELQRTTTLQIHKITPTKDKYTRLCEVLPFMHGGNFKLPLHVDNDVALWIQGYLKELADFRVDMMHAHDDQIDATTQALNFMLKKNLDYNTLNDLILAI